MTNKNWDLIRALHSEKTHIPPSVVDYIAVEEILRDCAVGLSNTTIASSYNMDIDYVNGCTNYFLEFSGWTDDLSVSPLVFFDNGELEKLSEFDLSDETIKQARLVCLKYNRIKELIDEFYG